MKDERERQRLADLYAEKSDAELLELAHRPQDLTEVAQQALEQVMRERKLEPEGDAPGEASGAIPEAPLQDFEAWLTAFTDAIRAREAVSLLDDAGIRSRVVDRNYSGNNGAGYGRASQLDLIVNRTDAERARGLLQEKLGLFPPPEVDPAGADAGDYAQLGDFSRAQALIVAHALGEHRFTYLWEDGSEDPHGDANRVFLDVHPERLNEAFALVESIAETLPADEDESHS